MTRIRAFHSGDEGAIADVCLRTADAGADATGILTDDRIWAEIFALPYPARDPGLAFVVEMSGRVAGYVVATDDTPAFEDWFHDEWWPVHGARFARPGGNPREVEILAYADGRHGGRDPYGATYPAHLHIDLLPELQGQGWGRRLIQTVIDELRTREVSGLHLVASAQNLDAMPFYDRLGFTRLPSSPDTQAFALAL